MKNLALMIALLTGSLALSTIPAESKAQQVNVNFSLFYNELGRYGTWVNSPRYGGQVWIYREAGFRPYYSRGSWQYTEMGWAWASDYDWGWAPFHYGRWEYDDYYGGWIWIPGYEWAPAWVSWSESGDYYGWAPLGYGINININIGTIPYDRWVFCSRPYMNTSRFYDHCAPFSQNRTIIKNYTIINNVYGGGNRRYYGGPGRNDYERYSRSPISPRNIDNDRRFRNRSYSDDNRDYSDNRRERRYEPNNRVDRNNIPDRERRYDVDSRQRNDRRGDIGQQRDNDRTPGNIDRRQQREQGPGSIGNGNGNGNNIRNQDWRRERPETNRNMREGNSDRGGNIGQQGPSREQRRYEQPQQQPSQQRQRGFEQRQPEYRGNQGNGQGRGQQRIENRGSEHNRGQGNGGNGNGRNGRRG